jgi:hypothetical protein
MGVLCFVHPLIEVDLPLFIDDFHLKIEITLNQKAFNSALVHSPHFSSNGPLSVVYELLRDYFVQNDFMSGFDLFFEICEHIVESHVPLSISPFVFCISIPNVEKTVWRHMSHRNQ